MAVFLFLKFVICKCNMQCTHKHKIFHAINKHQMYDIILDLKIKHFKVTKKAWSLIRQSRSTHIRLVMMFNATKHQIADNSKIFLFYTVLLLMFVFLTVDNEVCYAILINFVKSSSKRFSYLLTL